MSVPTTEAEIAAAFAATAKFSLGCMFAQVVVDTFFAGVLTMQVYTYWKYQKNDGWWIRGVVVAASMMNMGITAYLWFFIQYLFVENFGLWSPFADTSYLAPFPFLDSINSGISQSFFAYRAYRLCGRKIIIPIVIAALILTSIGAALSVLIIFSSFDSLFLAAGVTVPENIWLASIMSADIIITSCILYGLIRSKTVWSHTDRTITRLIRMTLESQVPPTIIAITFMVEFAQKPSSLFGSTLQGIQSKFYAMGLMYALNQRVSFRSQGVSENGNDEPVYPMSNRPTQKTIQVDVLTDTLVQTDTVVGGRPVGINRQQYEFDDEHKNKDSDSLEVADVRFGSQARLTESTR